ncbi:hypothetical protein C5748_18450 [Phyllobacterium phragmitis]|uniref:CopG family transcriptional regulator n=1 Tax=Phyllobacterium phragmitis TaxID=2670329 RepID=A0A2S9INM5_9HYPH|nr:hypothetical protein C5748_18450 [Phyllobacterium phragmitis]
MTTPYQAAQKHNRPMERIVFHLPAEEVEALDAWGVPAGMPSRAETIRTLLRKGLEAVAGEDS